MDTFGQRLKEVRLGLNLSQSEFAALGGVQKRAQINYEQSERKPDSDYLKAIAAHGVDVRYVVTGERMTPQEVALERRLALVRNATAATREIAGLNSKQEAEVQAAIFRASLKSLPDDEAELLTLYRAATEPGKAAILATIATLSGAMKTAPSPSATPAKRTRKSKE